MKLLVGGASSKFFHLKELTSALTKHGVECKLVADVDYEDGFPSRKISNWFHPYDRFNELIEEFKPDAVFVDRQNHFGLATIKANLPLYVHLRGDYWSELKWAKETMYKTIPRRIAIRERKKIADKCYKGSTMILPICEYLEKIVKKYYPEKPTYILQSGITTSHWYPAEGMKLKHPCVGLLQGAVIWGKTREMLTLTKVLEAMPEVTFYWVGDGSYQDRVLPALEKYKNFKWLGSLEYPDKVREYLTEIDIYALVSGIDMSPLTLQEAQLMKKPVVATNVGGIPELMRDGETGFLVEKGDHEDLIEKLSILLNDQQKTKQMGNAGKKFVENNFSWDKIANNFVDILKKTLN